MSVTDEAGVDKAKPPGVSGISVSSFAPAYATMISDGRGCVPTASSLGGETWISGPRDADE